MSRVPSLQKSTQQGSNNSRRNTYLGCNRILHINKGASTNRLEITFGESVYGPLIYYIMDTEDKFIEHSKGPKALKGGFNPVIGHPSSQFMLLHIDARRLPNLCDSFDAID